MNHEGQVRLRDSMVLQIITAFGTLLAYPATQAIYNLYFHPLSKFPGPKLYAASRLPFIYCLLTGKLTQREREFHKKYGDFLRLTPDEVSFATPNNQADNLITTSDKKFHARVRGLISHSFTEDSLRTQRPLIIHHADMLLSQLVRQATTPNHQAKGARVNLTDWLNFFTMDIIGSPLVTLKLVRTLFSYLKGMSLAATPRYYPTTEFLFNKLIPKSVIEGQKRHTHYANLRINRRLDIKTNRPDFITPFIRNNVNFENMSRDEILSTFNFIIVGSSETTTTTFTGIFNHLSKNNQVLNRLYNQIRSKYNREEDITIDSTS
ncbi:MAG: hypothetical protein L6R42_001281 [Xanthoria sp. 1 TBL-2021]|nr:MAG: hypothetical protein L6R42_001281 [Xanthoria sp. 1 TBL-2021]